jgi:hypothetical protein
MSKILSKSELVSAKNYFAEILLSSQMLNFVNIDVKIVSGNAPSGLCIIDEYNNQNKPRSFTIEINKNQSKLEILNAVAHEMVHVKQYVYGELNEQMSSWLGQKIDCDEVNYFEQPWEVEAYNLEAFLTVMYLSEKNG